MKFEKISEKWIMAMSVSIVLFCYGYACVFGAMTYHTNDDVAMQEFIWAVDFTESWWIPPWISIFLSYPLGVLTYLFPIKISWWYIASQISVAASLLVIHYASLRIAQIKGMPLWLVLGVLAVFDSIYSVICIAEIAFTMVPAIMGCAVAALAFYYPYSRRRKTTIVCGIAGLLFAIGHRWESGTIAAGFLLVVLAIVLSENYGLFSRKMLAGVAIFAVLIGSTVIGVYVLNNAVNIWAQGEEWTNYTTARSSWIDYAKETYEENPELYQSAGWTEDTYYFATNWIFLSDEITEESFHYLAEHSNINPHNALPGDNLKNSVKAIVQDPRMGFTLLVMFAVWSFALIVKLYEKDWKTVFYLIMDMAACSVVIGYLTLCVGRVLFRTLYIILLPTIFIAVSLLIYQWRNYSTRGWKGIVALGIVLVACVWSVSCYRCTQMLGRRASILEPLEREHTVLTTYESENRDKTFIHQGHNFITYRLPSSTPIGNAYGMGGSLWRSNYMKHFQNTNNIEQFNWTVFEMPHVYFLGRLNQQTAFILEYLQREYDCIGIAVLEQLEENYDIFCMKFIFEEDVTDYKTIYTLDDGSFIQVSAQQ